MGAIKPKELAIQLSNPCWQISVSSTSDKWKYIFENELYTDLSVLVGPKQEVIRCHRLILVIHSPVFESMLSHRWTNNSGSPDNELALPEDDPTLFKHLLHCFYTDNLNNSTPLSVEDLLALLLLAKKYICPAVASKCVFGLKSSLTETNAVRVYEAVKLLAEESELEKAAESFILNKANSIATLGELSKLSKENLRHFLCHDELNIDEAELFNAVYKWGEAECSRMELDPAQFIGSILSEFLPLIRFPLMSPEEFSTQVVSKDVLTLAETVQVYKILTTPPAPTPSNDETQPAPPTPSDPGKDKMHFNACPRSRKIFSYIFKRLKGHGYDFGKKWQNFCFQVNRDIRLVSLGLYRSVATDVELDVGIKICDYEMSTTYAEIEDKVRCAAGSEDVFHIKFPTLVKIQKDTLYTISYIIKGMETFYKAGEPKKVELMCSADTLTFVFQDGKVDSDMDQVPELCFQLF